MLGKVSCVSLTRPFTDRFDSGNQFDVEGAILATLKNLAVDLQVSSAVNLDEFPTDLAFNQTGVPAMVRIARFLYPPGVEFFTDRRNRSLSHRRCFCSYCSTTRQQCCFAVHRGKYHEHFR